MSVNKLLTFTAVGVVSLGVATAALAGGPEYTPAPSYAGVYIEGNVGYALRNWLNDTSNVFGVAKSLGFLTSSSNGRGGFTGGADVGYQFNQYFSVEAGWMYLPRIKGTFNVSISGKVDSGLAYGAFKITAPVYENTYIFGKLGAGYVYNSMRGFPAGATFPSTDLTNGVTDSKFWNPLWAAGIQYYFNPNTSINFQYMNIAGYHRSSDSNFSVPDAHLFTVGLGYKFLM